MHKRRLNELTLHAILAPDGPLLVKSGVESGADPTLPSMNFVRTRHPHSGQRTVYLPGAGLKGALRSHVERIIRTVAGEKGGLCCDPLGSESCGKQIDQENAQRRREKRDPLTTAEEYRLLCLACRIFGHTAHASHFLSSDAYPLQAIDSGDEELSVRQGVAINRFSGGVGVGPFEIETLVGGLFQLRLASTNFARWQGGLRALALRDRGDGRLLRGFGKSRGLGRVKLYLQRLEIAYPGRFTPESGLRGAGSLAPDLVKDYDLIAGDALALPGGRSDAKELAWGRPTLCFGLDALPQKYDEIDQDALLAAHQAVINALGKTVPSWAAYPKVQAAHA